MTKEELQKCLDRLRDPNSKPLRYRATNNKTKRLEEFSKTDPMCCIAHCAHVLGLEGASSACYSFMTGKTNDRIVDTMLNLMDQQKKSLPEIADWMQANIIPT